MPEQEQKDRVESAWWDLEQVTCTSMADLEGGQTAYRMIGTDGPVLLLLHGAFSFSYIWKDLVQSIRNSGLRLRVLLLDFWGRGSSPWPADKQKNCKVKVLVAQVKELLEFLRIEGELAVVGYDLGAVVAAKLTEAIHVDILILLSFPAVARPLKEMEETARVPVLGSWLFSIGAKAWLEEEHRQDFFRKDTDAPHADIRDLHVRMIQWQIENTDGYLDAIASTVQHFPLESSWSGMKACLKKLFASSKFQCPVLVMWSDADTTASSHADSEAKRDLVDFFEGDKTLSTVEEKCGHNIVLEHAGETAAEIYEFLKAQLARLHQESLLRIEQQKQDAMKRESAEIELKSDSNVKLQVVELLTVALQAPHEQKVLDEAIAAAEAQRANGVLFDRLKKLRSNQARLMDARQKLDLAVKTREWEELNDALANARLSFKTASASGVFCLCLNCGGWAEELSAAQRVFLTLSKEKGQLEAMQHCNSMQTTRTDPLMQFGKVNISSNDRASMIAKSVDGYKQAVQEAQDGKHPLNFKFDGGIAKEQKTPAEEQGVGISEATTRLESGIMVPEPSAPPKPDDLIMEPPSAPAQPQERSVGDMSGSTMPLGDQLPSLDNVSRMASGAQRLGSRQSAQRSGSQMDPRWESLEEPDDQYSDLPEDDGYGDIDRMASGTR